MMQRLVVVTAAAVMMVVVVVSLPPLPITPSLNADANWQPRHVHLAYGNISSEMVVTWSTLNSTGVSSVEWGLEATRLTNTSNGRESVFVDGGAAKATQWIHRVHLRRLAPNTTYFYHAGSALGWSAVFAVTTAAGPAAPLRVAIFGDLGVVNGQSLDRLKADAAKGMYDAMIHVGDFAYDMDTNNASRGDQFMENIEPMAASVPYMTCPGNHEAAYDFSNYRSRFSMPNYNKTQNIYYSFDLGLVHFIGISTELYYFTNINYLPRLQQQYDWLVSDLETASAPGARGKRPWIILFGHRPMYCSLNDVDDCTKIGTLTRVGLPLTHWYALEPLLAKYGVDVAVWAHEHAYERLWPMYDYQVLNGSVEAPYTNPRGPVHVTTGSAGCQERLDPFTTTKPAWSAKRVMDYGYTRLTIHNKTHLHWDQVSDDKGGELTDTVWIIRNRHGAYI